ncbi:hypothetical protein SNE40_004778 [Patella caerulea]|uniref:Uncharacterized protein n=1 Tax=Patella caerulea TaxID=87958 RepID=A0AAN8K3Q4_PATCE
MGNWISTLSSYIPYFPGNQERVTLTQRTELEPNVVRIAPPSDIEVATSCERTLYQADACVKVEGHKKYIPYYKFTAEDVPSEYQNDRLFKYIINVGKRVVRIAVKVTELDIWYGTGVVTKYRGQQVIAVPRSLLTSETMATQTDIDFFYETSDYKGVFKSKGTGLVDFPNNQELILMTFDPAPEVICKSYIPDIDRFKVEVTVTDEDDNLRTGDAEVFTEEGEYYVMTNPDLIDTDFQAENCQIKFCIDGSLPPSAGTGVFYMDETDTIISFDPVPEVIKRELTKRDALWHNGGDVPVRPFIISHPHGTQKSISIGTAFSEIQKEMVARSDLKDIITPGYVSDMDDSGYIKKNILVHTASTCPGSCGGLVIAVGDDSKIRGGYSQAFIHLQGHESVLLKLQTESENINVSTLIGWI